jgi:predicted deacylase
MRQFPGVAEGMDVIAFLEEFSREAEQRGFTKYVLCETPAGPLILWDKPGQGPCLTAGMHGDEPAGPHAALALLKEGSFDALAWTVCPAFNPTGLAACRRENIEGLDLNRDYLALRSQEVRTHAAWLSAHPCPTLLVSLHEDWETTGFYFYEINQGADRPERAASILEAVQPWLPIEQAVTIDDHEIRSTGWIYHAPEADLPENWPEAIFVAKMGCPLSFTFETPSALPLELRVAGHIAGVKAAVRAAGLGS